jgi:tetratricopeptide (TPR) repeat protein
VIAAVATVAIVRGEHLAEMRASRLYQTFVDASDEARGVLSIPPSDRQAYDAAVQAARHAVPLFDLSANGLRDNESFRRLHRDQQQVIRETLTELHFLLAFSAEIQASSLTGDDYRNQLTHALTQNGLAQQAVTPSPWAVFYQRSLLLRKLGRNDEAEQVLDNAPERSSESLFDRYLTSLSLFQSGDLDGSKVLLGRLADETPKNYFVWHLLGSTHMELGELDQAEECFTVCKALSPTSPLAYFQRGVARLEKKKFVEAKGDFDHVLRLTPGNAAALINRAQAWRGLKQYRHAIEDLNTAEKSASYKTRIPLLRAKLWRSLGEEEKAIADIQTGLRVQPVDADDWISRGLVKLPEDVDGALADIRKAVSLRPTYRVGLHNLAMVLAEHKHDYAEALNTYDTMLALNPKDFQALRSRAVVHARRRDRDKATADMARALRLDRSSQTYYQAACVYALVSDGEGLKKHQAVGLLKKALQLDGETWRHFAKADDDLAAIRELSDFQSLLSAVDSVCEQQ